MMPWRAAAVTGGYLVAWLALDFFGYVLRVAPDASVWNPADGLSLALVCVFGPRLIPLLFVGPLINGWLFWLPDVPMAAFWNAVSSTIGYGIAGWMLHARRTDARLETLNDAAAFLGIAFFGAVLAAGIGAFGLAWSGVIAAGSYPQAAFSLLAGDTLGIFGLGAFFLRAMLSVRAALYQEEIVARDEPVSARRVRPSIVLLQALVTLIAIAASPFRWGVFSDSPTQFVLIAVVWVALTHGAAGAAIVVVAVNLGMLVVQQFGSLPLALPDQQLLLAAVGITGVLVGAAVSEGRRRTAQLAASRTELERRRATADALQQVETNLTRAQSIAGMGSYGWTSSGGIWWSDQLYRLYGLSRDSYEPRRGSFLDFIHPDDRDTVRESFSGVIEEKTPLRPVLDAVRVVRTDGVERRFRVSRQVERDADGRVVNVTGVIQDVTEDFEARRALDESRERLSAVAANLPGVVFQHRITPSGGIAFTFVSDGVRRLFGVTPEAVIERTNVLLDLIHPDDGNIFRLAIQEASRAGSPWNQEFRVRAPSGLMWIRGTAQVRRIEGEGALVWDGVLLDITAEKLAGEELRRSEERFRRIASDAPMAIAIIGADDGVVRFANRACEEMFRYTVGEMRDVQTRGLCVEPGEFAKLRPALRRSGVVSNREMHLRRRDGAQFWGIFSFMSIESAGKGEILACGFDSTELRDARAEVSRQAVDLSIKLKELRCLYMVSRLTNDTIRPIEDICRDLVNVLPQGLRFPEKKHVRLVLRGEEFRSASWETCQWTLASAIVADAATIGELEVCTGREPAHESLAPFLQEERDLVETVALHVGRMVAERDLSTRLVQAQKLESLGRLTGGIAHDFNNLLTIVFGNLEIAEDQCNGNVTLQKCVANAMQASRRAADLTAQLQAFSRRQALLPTVVPLNELMSGMTALLRRSLGESIEMVTELTDSPITVHVDPTQMEAAILNLVLNARDAMPSGGKLTISTRTVELAGGPEHEIDPGTYVELTIADTGTGMPADVAKRVFEPFFTTKEVGKGSGLGLSMVFGFVKQSGGHIGVTSEVGTGTVFCIHLPLVSEQQQTADDASDKARASLAGECVLIVEDEPQVLDYVARLLRTSGYRAVTAANGPEALTLLKGGCAADLLLTDIGLPGGMTGVELAREARMIEPELKVVLASGYSYDHLVTTGAITEDLPIIFKPFVRRDLLARIRTILDGGTSALHSGSMDEVA